MGFPNSLQVSIIGMKIENRLCSRPGNGVSHVEKASEIDPGIRRMVEILNSKGLETELSCEGHPDRQSMFCHYGHVTIRPKAYHRYLATKARRLKAFLRACPQVSLVVRYFGGRQYPVMAQPVFVFYVPNEKQWSASTHTNGAGKAKKYRETVRSMMTRWEDAADRLL